MTLRHIIWAKGPADHYLTSRVKEGAYMTSIRCELFGKPAVPSVPRDEEMPPAAYPGLRKTVSVEGITTYEFECFSDAHAGRDHEFRVEERVLIIPWDKFRLQGKEVFLEHEVGWKEPAQWDDPPPHHLGKRRRGSWEWWARVGRKAERLREWWA